MTANNKAADKPKLDPNSASNFEQLRRNPIFARSDRDALAALAKACERIDVGAGEFISDRGETSRRVYVLIEGTVRTYHKHGEREITIVMLRPPATFGDMDAIRQADAGGPSRKVVSAVTLVPTSLLSISREDFLAHLNRDVYSLRMTLKDICARRAWGAERERSAFYGNPALLANFLLEYLDWAGKDTPEGIAVHPHLTWEQIGNAVGITARAVARTMANWKAVGAVSYKDGRLLVHDPDALERECGGTRFKLTYKCTLADDSLQ